MTDKNTKKQKKFHKVVRYHLILTIFWLVCITVIGSTNFSKSLLFGESITASAAEQTPKNVTLQ